MWSFKSVAVTDRYDGGSLDKMGKSYKVDCGDPEATGECGRKLQGSGCACEGGSYLDVSGRKSGSFEGNELPEGNDRAVHEACRRTGVWEVRGSGLQGYALWTCFRRVGGGLLGCAVRPRWRALTEDVWPG